MKKKIWAWLMLPLLLLASLPSASFVYCLHECGLEHARSLQSDDYNCLGKESADHCHHHGLSMDQVFCGQTSLTAHRCRIVMLGLGDGRSALFNGYDHSRLGAALARFQWQSLAPSLSEDGSPSSIESLAPSPPGLDRNTPQLK